MEKSALFKYRTGSVLIQLFRYTIVGGLAFAVDFSLLFLLTEFLHLYYLVSAAIAFSCGLITNYTLSIIWVFDIRSVSSKPLEFIAFAFIGIIGLILNHVFIWFFTEIVLFHYLVSKSITAVLVYFWNFTVRKVLLFT